jgi:serine/threonine-protein phosphatase 2B catalytic subunit
VSPLAGRGEVFADGIRRKSDIENERLPPDIIDVSFPNAECGVSIDHTPQPDEDNPASPSPTHSAPLTPDEPSTPQVVGASPITASPISPGTPSTPTGGTPGMPWRRGHSRQTSLGTTKTSPSTRRRSLENTMHLIRDVVDGRDANADGQLQKLAEVIASPTKSRADSPSSGEERRGSVSVRTPRLP